MGTEFLKWQLTKKIQFTGAILYNFFPPLKITFASLSFLETNNNNTTIKQAVFATVPLRFLYANDFYCDRSHFSLMMGQISD